MTNEEYIGLHRLDDVRTLALKSAPEGIDIKWCLQQIEGWQKAREKLPRWAGTDGLWYPPVLSMEQCSGEQTAEYKRGIVCRLLPEASDRQAFADLTGGYGIDFSYLAPLFGTSTYVERNPELCRIAGHNFGQLHLDGASVVCADSTQFLEQGGMACGLVYLDPARRDNAGRKTVAIADCTPDVVQLQDRLMAVGRFVMIKLSPMLDISAALSVLRHVREVHVVSVRGECKELLFVLDSKYEGSPTYYAANLGIAGEVFTCTDEQRKRAPLRVAEEHVASDSATCLYEPHASILKAGLQDVLCERYGVAKLHPMSNLFVSASPVPDFPGRSFCIVASCGFNKKELRAMLAGVSKANITVRNFPASVAEIRKKLRLAEGGDVYLFATTVADGSHVLIRCTKHD
ncbi:MAG: hypothetical protein IKL71_04205 [Bacteroidaceae bacterium]|nr:hypothetical protein [Bacteroidaceae bacterium]